MSDLLACWVQPVGGRCGGLVQILLALHLKAQERRLHMRLLEACSFRSGGRGGFIRRQRLDIDLLVR